MTRGAALTAIFTIALGLLPFQGRADDEAPNSAHVTTDEHGRCFARSVPKHNYDPDGEPRQQGTTTTWYVTKDGDIPVDTYDWYSHKIFIACTFGGSSRKSDKDVLLPVIRVARMGAWHRLNPKPDHLALAFYADGELLKSYSTFDIAGGGQPPRKCKYRYENMVHSISHYFVFALTPEPSLAEVQIGESSASEWVDGLEIYTVGKRKLSFRLDTGELMNSEEVNEKVSVRPRFGKCH